jgi:hypothetical protein
MTRAITMGSKLWRVAAALGVAVLLGSGAAQAQQGQSWVFPAYPTTPPEDKVITTIDTIHYEERRFEPELVVEAIPPGAESYASPEQAFISRLSAMIRGDYDRFMASWDDLSRQLTEANDAERGQTPTLYIETWRSIFDAAKATMVRRIDTGDYVVITYKYVLPDGTVLVDIEFPGMFREFDDGWRATQELARDDLLAISPWVTGQTDVTQVVR